jgi:DNA polymerase delta subunit 3
MIEDVIDDAPKPKRKRKEKKVIPVGKNGLPKRRIVKTRKTKDAKGFTGVPQPCQINSCHVLIPEK